MSFCLVFTVSVYVMLLAHGWHSKILMYTVPEAVYLDRVGRHVAHEVGAVGVIQHGHQSEGIPQQAIQLVNVLSRGWRLTQGEL